MIKLLDLVLEDGENVTGGVAGLKLRCEGMSKRILLGLSLICFQSSIEDGLKIGRGCISGWSLRHRKSNTGELVGDERDTGRLSGQRGTSILVRSRHKSLDGGRWSIASRIPDKQKSGAE